MSGAGGLLEQSIGGRRVRGRSLGELLAVAAGGQRAHALRGLALVLFGFGLSGCAASAPAFVREHAQATAAQPGVPVVAFVDFECGYCRVAHARLHQAASAEGTRLRLGYRHVPLRSHPHAAEAARAAICAEQVGAEARAVEHLFEVGQLGHTTDQLLAAAEVFGHSRESLAECMSSEAVTGRLRRDRQLFEQAQFDGVPVLYIGELMLDGAKPLAEYAQALQQAH